MAKRPGRANQCQPAGEGCRRSLRGSCAGEARRLSTSRVRRRLASKAFQKPGRKAKPSSSESASLGLIRSGVECHGGNPTRGGGVRSGYRPRTGRVSGRLLRPPRLLLSRPPFEPPTTSTSSPTTPPRLRQIPPPPLHSPSALGPPPPRRRTPAPPPLPPLPAADPPQASTPGLTCGLAHTPAHPSRPPAMPLFGE
jgi:hypothetical protein